MDTTRKIPLPSFLKLLTSNNVSTPKAMLVAGKIYKEFNTPDMLSQLTDIKMKAAGIDDKDLRRSALAAFRKAGYSNRRTSKKEPTSSGQNGSEARPSPSSTVQVITTPTKKKRKREDDINEFLPEGPVDEASMYGSLEFNETLDEDILKTKHTVVNRAPLMTAWATVVAERMGFQREEALSIAAADVYTEMNAISKGVSLGIFDASRNNGMEATREGSQPYVDIMGRRVPLYQMQSEKWRALSGGSPVQPSTAFSYISRAFRQTTSYVIGALRLLANSYGPQELNQKGFALYAEFRPSVEGWGGRGELRCDKILALRRKAVPEEIKRTKQPETSESVHVGEDDQSAVGKVENAHQTGSDKVDNSVEQEEPDRKKPRLLSLEEYEAILDQDKTFHDVDLNFSKTGVL